MVYFAASGAGTAYTARSEVHVPFAASRVHKAVLYAGL
jgi:hypothetical protein